MGGIGTRKKPGHFEVRKPPASSHGRTFYLKKVDDLFLVVALKTEAANDVSP